MFSKTKSGILISPFLKEKSDGKKIAYVSLITAINVVGNALLEFKTLDVQFSFTILLSILTGIILGGGLGFISTFVADLLGYVISSWGLVYMPWVGISTAMMAFISGWIFSLGNNNNNKALIVKTACVCLLTFIICTAGINSIGFYLYNKHMGFSTAVLQYVAETFGKEVKFLFYLLYRLFFKGQILNSIFNYILLFIAIPLLKKLKVF